MKARTVRRLRPWVQALAFILFVVLLVAAGQVAFLPADLFFRLDPLAGLAGMVAARRLVPALLVGGLMTLALTVAFGRAWCGWLCPLGTVLDWTPAHKPAAQEADLNQRWRQAKYFLLTVIVLAAVLGNLTLIFLDPITLLYRTMTTAIWPALVAIISGIERALVGLPVPGLLDAVVTVDNWLRSAVLPMYQPVYQLGGLTALLFVTILALNAIRARFWCRYLCPLGALLGLVSKIAWLRRTVSDRCVACARCARACPTGTIDPARDYASDPSECIMCLECVPACPKDAQPFRGHLRPPVLFTVAAWQPYDPSRRQFLASAGAAVVVAGLSAVEPPAERPPAFLLRPPGARPPGATDPDFLSRCIRCGICLKVCPTSALQPSLTAAGWAGVWTPVLVPRLGYCDFSCNACGQACPTDAIPRLTLEDKRQTVIGHAYVDRSRCLPWASGRSCITCEEMCPLPEKAIQLEEVEVWTADGQPLTLQRPHVLQERCIGCGICENHCPLGGQAAIRVYTPTDLGVVTPW
ncbi:MAG: 4Fe-4S binding protein [Anaerolineae bacterium]|nr:4Fe-4S binding protein [Anaerolineae bacterium]